LIEARHGSAERSNVEAVAGNVILATPVVPLTVHGLLSTLESVRR
jgi:hypothetical protein